MLNVLQMSLLMLFHPHDTLDIIKRERDRFRLRRVLLLMVVFALVNYTYTFYVNYVLGTMAVTQANILMDLAMATLPLLTWVVAAYAITAIVVGECSFTELLTASSYCLVPVIVLKPILGLLSHAMTTAEADIFSGLTVLMYAWMVILLFTSLKRLNDYSASKTVWVTLVAIVAMAIIWGVLLLVFTLLAQMVGFFQEVIKEIQLKY